MTAPPTPRMYGWRSGRQVTRELLLGATLGVVLTLVEGGGAGEIEDWRTFFRNATIAVCIMGLARLLETMLSWAIQQSRYPTFFRVTLYAACGWVGYFAGAILSSPIHGGDPNDFNPRSFHFIYSLLAATLISIVIGFVLHHNQKREDRLRASVERLKEHEFAEKELEIARSMQERLLPPADIEGNGYRITARTQAAHIVAGDFHDVIRLDDGAVAVLAADVSGKGMAASLLMASCKAAVPFLASTGGAAEVMNALNRTLADQLQRREFVAMVYCRFEPQSGLLEIANAGMPDPLLLGNGTIRTIVVEGERLPLGARRDTRYQATRFQLAPGEKILLFSDGLPEAQAGENPIGYEKVESMARHAGSVDQILGALQAQGLRIDDDLTLVMLERQPPNSSATAVNPSTTRASRS